MNARIIATILALHLVHSVHAAPPGELSSRDQMIRERYETVLLRNPFQKRAFDRVYEGYSTYEGVNAWVDKLKPKDKDQSALLLLGQIYDRQFKTAEAVTALEKAAKSGESRPEFKVLLGTLYYKIGKDEESVKLLGESLDTLADLDQRSHVCRMLGNLFLRQGKRDEAIAVWKRITEQNPTEIFSQLELAEIYEDNRMWDEAIVVYNKIADLSESDPYRRCRALRSVGDAHLRAERHTDAIANYEKALGMVAPGNWLFEDLKLRLVGVYQDMGDLNGLVNYTQARLEQSPTDLEFRDLLAETFSRMAKFPEAEAEYRFILERNPRHATTYEKLIGLYNRMKKESEIVATYEKLIELFPKETDYLRRLGEFHLQSGQPDDAKKTWQRVLAQKPAAGQWAELAGWYESYEFPDEAAAAFEKAIGLAKNKEWTFRLAGLKFQKGDTADAKKLWLSVLDPNASSAEEYTEVASILATSKMAKDATTLLRTAMEKDPDNLEHRLTLAKNLTQTEEFEAALKEYEALAAQNENEYLRVQGEVGRLDSYAKLGILKKKQEEWEKELEQAPESIDLITRLARLYDRQGNKTKAIELYERRVDLQPKNANYLRDLATTYKRSRMPDEAIDSLKKLVDMDKVRSRAFYRELLDIYLGLDMKDEALATAKKVVSLAPGDPETRLDLAQVYSIYREHDQALDEYRHALRIEPNEPDYHRQYGAALMSQQLWGEAQEAFRKMLETAQTEQTRISAIQSLTRIYQQQDRLEELTSEFQRRIRSTPKKLTAYEELAAIHKEAGAMNRVVEVLESGLSNVDDKEPALKSLIRVNYEASDFDKVRNYYEQLLAMSGKPSAFEYERLGKIYAQLGDIEKAKETWNKIIEASDNDPKAVDRLAKILQTEGFPEEAVGIKARAVELDPYNYKRRYEYANMLTQAERHTDALAQLQEILDIGDRPEFIKQEKEKEKKVRRLTRGGGQFVPTISPYQFMYGIQSYNPYYGGRSSWYGAFAQFRPSLVANMVQVARNSIGEDAFIERFTKRQKANPQNLQTSRDLMMIYQMLGRIDDALKTSEALLKQAPDDAEFAQSAALYHSSKGDQKKAIAILEELVKRKPSELKTVTSFLIPLYFGQKLDDKAIAAANRLIEQSGNDFNTIYTMANLMNNQKQTDLARKLYAKAAELNPAYQSHTRRTLAEMDWNEGKKEAALKMYRETLFGGETNQATAIRYASRTRQMAIYHPEKSSSRSYYSPGSIRPLPANVAQRFDYNWSMAFKRLAEEEKDEQKGATEKRLFQLVQDLNKTSKPGERSRAQTAARLLCAWHVQNSDYDQALKVLETLFARGHHDIEWYNIAIYIRQKQEKYDEMVALYDQIAKHHSTRQRDILKAHTSIALFREEYEKAGELIRQLAQSRIAPKEMIALINRLNTVGQRELAKSLLEEHLRTSSRSSEALSLLAKIHAADGENQKAIQLAMEAWERRIHGGRSSSSSYYSSGYLVSTFRSSSDVGLSELHKYHAAAGKSAALLKDFEQRLERQPGSVRLHENLAQLYSLNRKPDDAIKVYETLAEKRPHLLRVKLRIAGLYTEKNNFEKARQLYESLLTAHPAAYDRISWDLRNLYQRMGKGKELRKMEDNMAKKATNPGQLQSLARRFQDSGDYEKAAELWRKVIKLQPQSYYMTRYLVDCLIKAGKYAEARQAYDDLLDSPQMRMNRQADHYTIKHMVGLYNVMGELDTLKQRTQERLKEEKDDLQAKAVLAHISTFETDFDTAYESFGKMAASGRDPNAMMELVYLGRNSGRPERALDLLEKSGHMDSMYNKEYVAELYALKGDQQKAQRYLNEWYDRHSNSGSTHYTREMLRRLIQYDLWDDAEKFVRQNRTRDFSSSYTAREIDRQIATGYVEQGRFTNVVGQILSKDKVLGRDLDLIKEIGNRLRSAKRTEDLLELYQQLIAKNPKDHKLRFEYGKTVLNESPAEAVDVFRDIVKQAPKNRQYRDYLNRALIREGKLADVIASQKKLVAKKATDADLLKLAGYQEQAGQVREALASIKQAISVADPSKKGTARTRLLSLEAKHSDYHSTLRNARDGFKRKPASGSFVKLLRALHKAGRLDECRQLLEDHADKNYLTSQNGRTLQTIFFDLGDFITPLDFAWSEVRYTEYYNRSYYFDRWARNYVSAGQFDLMMDDFHRRIHEEEPVNLGMLNELGKSCAKYGRHQRAIEVIEELLQHNPFDRELIRLKISSLIALGRNNEAHRLLQKVPGVMDPNHLPDDQLQLVRSLFSLNRTNEANTAVSNLLSWAGGVRLHRDLGDLFLGRKEYARAAPHWQRVLEMKEANYADDAILALIKCAGLTGRPDEALAQLRSPIAQAKKASYINPLKQWLSTVRDGELLLKLSPTLQEMYPADARMYSLEAHGWALRKDTNKAVLALEKPFQLPVNRDRHLQLANGLRNFVVGKKLLPAVLRHARKHPDSPLQLLGERTLLFSVGRADQPYLQELRQHLAGYTPNDTKRTMELAEAFRQIKDHQEAARLYRHLLANGDQESRQSAAIALIRLGQPEGALPVLRRMMTEEPAKLLADSNALEAIAKGATKTEKDAFLKKIVSFIPYNTHGGFIRFHCNYHGPDKQAALDELPKIIKLRNLSGRQIQDLARIATEEKMYEVAKAGFNRLVAGDYDIAFRWNLLGDLIDLHLKTGDHQSAVDALVHMAPHIYDRKGMTAVENFFHHADQNTVTLLRKAITARAKQASQDSHLSELLGFYAELAEKTGQDIDPVKLAGELGLPAAEGQQAAGWTHAIEDWEISGPLKFNANWEIKQPSRIIKILRGQLTNSPPVKWRKIAAADTPGFVDLARHLNVKDIDKSGHLAHARTTVMCAKARATTFQISATGFIRVWVNGNMLKPTWKDPLPDENPGHAVFTANLKPGENTIWVKVGHLKPDGWRFGLRMPPEPSSNNLAGRR